MDTTQDVSKMDQLSQVYRYVTVVKNDMDIATDIQINEVFLGFEATVGSSASELENKILGSIEKNRIHLSKGLGQGYDGAANMSGVYSGVHARITEKEPLARYVHCAAHNLNLALNDSVKNVPGVKQFYDTVERLYNFFGHSIKRWALLGEIMTPVSRNVTLKSLCPTRWSSRHDALFALRHRYGDIIRALDKISLTSDKNDERGEANSRLTDAESAFRVNDFNACLDIIIRQLSQIFTSLNGTVNIFEAIHPNTLLQARDEELHQAARRLSEQYSRDIAPSFPGQLFSFRTSFRDQIPKQKSVADLAKMLIVNHLAVISAFSERMTEKKMDIQRIMDEFAERKARRMPSK
ncbi:hypothetical protein F7725_021412 [Scomber scombrus]|uniref:Zinc finger MYM-type 1-like n=1 Tax=Scomber scombrus TaxID=13677 RepID=A0AAV1QE05_SCOSC